MSKFSDEVRQAAEGNWHSILSSCGLTSEQLDPKQHQPCPKCDGTDRYRAFGDVAQTGGVLCNQCGKFADGFATVMWLRGCTFPKSIEIVGEQLGMKKPKNDPTADLSFREMFETDELLLKRHYPEISLDAWKLNGARMASFKKRQQVVVLPVIGPDLNIEKPVGYVMLDPNGQGVNQWDKKQERMVPHKTLLTKGSGKGLVGTYAIEQLRREAWVTDVWKTEGITDMLSVFTAIPDDQQERVVSVTNSNGASQRPVWMAPFIAKANVAIVHDMDTPGQNGAVKWSKAVGREQKETWTKRVKLPFPMEDDHGQDVRDFLRKHKYEELELLRDQTEPEKGLVKEDGTFNFPNEPMPDHTAIMKVFQLEILYEEHDGGIRLFSTYLRQSSTIRNIERLRPERLIQIAGGWVVDAHLGEKADTEHKVYTITQVREAIAGVACHHRGRNDERGIGIWQSVDELGNETGTIVLVGDNEAAIWKGEGKLHKVETPQIDGLVVDFSSRRGYWYDFPFLDKCLVDAANPAWCESVIQESIDLFSRWNWRNDPIDETLDPTLLTGLILATWVQTVWEWRPLISVIGETKAGKTYLFEAIAGQEHHLGIFGKLAFSSSNSTEAGIRQGIGNTAQAVFIDELEKSKDREKIWETLRSATRGGIMAKGTTSQRGTTFRLRHIVWTAAIESGMQRIPDFNRLIQFELEGAKLGEYGKLNIPPGAELFDLGQRLLAIAVRHALQAKAMAVKLKKTQVQGVDGRVIESYSVPTAMLSSALAYNPTEAENLLQLLLSSLDPENPVGSDAADLIEDILGAKIQSVGTFEKLTVAQVLRLQKEGINWDEKWGQSLESYGLKLFPGEALFIVPKQVLRHLLKDSDRWQGQDIGKHLRRLVGSESGTKRLKTNGKNGASLKSGTGNPQHRGVRLPLAHLPLDTFHVDSDDDMTKAEIES